MDQKFFRIPFASNGDKQAVPDEKNAEGYVSFTDGWGVDYAKDLYSDAHAKAVEREAMNSVLNAITFALRQYQTDAFPEWITPANNGGTAYAYGAGIVVRHRKSGTGPFTSYVSLSDNNTAEPGTDVTKWQAFIYRRATQNEADAGTDETTIITPSTLQQSIKTAIGDVTTELAPYLLPVGVIVAWPLTVPPDGWIEANGQAFDREKNPRLSAVFPGGRVPDYRGIFLRGWAHGSSAYDPEPGRALGSVQEQSIIAHSHGIDLGYNGDGGNGKDKSPPYLRFPQPKISEIKTTAYGGDETRPTNIAVMYIVKTDQADNIKPDRTPTNIVVTPSALTIGAGKTQQFSATVMPVDLASSYPVTWLSTNTAVGTIDSSGLFRAVGAGTTDIIASVSSGLSVRVTVRVDVLLTSISLAAIPDQVTNNIYELKITKTPSNATETIRYATTDSAIASVTADGQLVGAGAGKATITVSGSISDISASRVVNVTAAPVDEGYLLAENNLSEIADTGAEAQADARKNIGLGALATLDVITSAKTGAVPVSHQTIKSNTDLNSITEAGQYFQNITSRATLALNYPQAVAGVLVVYQTGIDNGSCRQVYMPYNSTSEYRRYAFGNPLVFSTWKEY